MKGGKGRLRTRERQYNSDVGREELQKALTRTSGQCHHAVRAQARPHNAHTMISSDPVAYDMVAESTISSIHE